MVVIRLARCLRDLYLQKAEASGDPLVLAAAQWRSVVDTIRGEANNMLTKNEFYELSYEDLIEDPVGNIDSIWQWIGLDQSKDASAAIQEVTIRNNENRKSCEGFNQAQRNVLLKWLECPLST